MRDPRDVIASWLHEVVTDPGARRMRILRMCYNWALSLDLARRYQAALGDRYRVLRYEDLVREPSIVMTRVTAALGLRMDAVVTRPTELAVAKEMNTSYSTTNNVDRVSPEQIGRFREGLAEQEQRLIENRLGPHMRACGYRLDEPAGPVDSPLPAEWRRGLGDFVRRRRIRRAQRRARPLDFLGPA